MSMIDLPFCVTPQGKLPEGIRQTLSLQIPKYAGKKMRITFAEDKRKRTLNQNAYWFGVLDKYAVPIFRDAGSNWSNYKLHCWLMQELGYEEAMALPDGQIIAARKHSRDFTTTDWEEYMERARAHLATEFNIFLPLPHEDLRQEDAANRNAV